MNKIDNAIKTVHHMDFQANQKGYLNRIHPLAKLLITIIYIISLTSIDKYNLVTTLAMSIYLILVSIIGDLSIKKALKSIGIEELQDRQIYRLSGGEKKLASIATVLSMKPDILIFDEPTIALDPKNRRRFINVLNSLKGTKIVTSHDLDLIYDTCDRTILIADGKIIFDGDTKRILQNKDLLENNGLELPLSLQRR